ncbi:MAG: YcgN family cysteine cluster protein [Desulfobacteraceae bacterium]|nr:YcgN family cysteine cluster protein [Desulfobacteraceae bacterium]
MNKKFWQHKTFSEMSFAEWEALCDGCGRCCLHKLEYADTGEIAYTSVACRFLDISKCRCTAYENRKAVRNECLCLTPENICEMTWLPKTCAYRMLFEGRDLASWHPLVTGDPESVHTAGISVRNKVIPEDWINPDDLETYIIEQDLAESPGN